MSTAGYSGTPLPRKLGIREGSRRAAGWARPTASPRRSASCPRGSSSSQPGASAVDVAVLFALDAATVRGRFAGARVVVAARGRPLDRLAEAELRRRHATSTRTVVREIGLAGGLVDNKVCAIDATWSGLRFVWRLRDRPS